MEPKKNDKYNLEKKSPLFFSIGLIVALLCVTAAFEWRMPYDPLDLRAKKENVEPMIDIIITRIPEPEPPKPVKREEPKPEDKPPSYAEVVEATNEIPKKLKENLFEEDPVPDFKVEELPVEEPEVFEGVVETMPSFPGGIEAFYKYINENVEYTRKARTLGITGRVFVQFVIDENGKITEVKAIKGIGAGLDEEAVRVLENAPRWNPGKQRGRPVKFRMVLPIHFELDF